MNDMRASLKQQNSSPWLMHEEWTLWPSKASDYSKKLQRLARTSLRDVAGQWFANPRSYPQPHETSGFTCRQNPVCRSMKWLQSCKSEVFPPRWRSSLFDTAAMLISGAVERTWRITACASVCRIWKTRVWGFVNPDFNEDFSRIWTFWYCYFCVLEPVS